MGSSGAFLAPHFAHFLLQSSTIKETENILAVICYLVEQIQGEGRWLVKENANDDTCAAAQIEYADTNDHMSILKPVNLCRATARAVFVISPI